jgi:hypothetical protein
MKMEDAELNKTMVVTAGISNNFNQEKIEEMMDIGLSLLQSSNQEDTDSMKLRIVEKDVWIIEDPQAVTLLLDYEY